MIIVNKKRIVVTGGMGYVGSVLVRELLNKGHEVVVLDKLVFDQEVPAFFKNKSTFSFIKGDIRHIEDLMETLKDVDVVVHLASIVGDPSCDLDYDETISTNFESTKLLVEIAKFRRVKRIIFASTASVYGHTRNIVTEKSKTNPLSLYAKTKLDSEKVILKANTSDLESVVLRLSTVFGWSERMRFDLVLNFLTAMTYYEKTFNVFGGKQYRPLIHVVDVARSILMVINSSKVKVAGQIFNVGSANNNVKIIRLAKLIKRKYPMVNFEIKRQETDKRDYRLDYSKSQKVLGFKAKYSLDYGIDEVFKMLKKGKIKDYKKDKYYNVKYLYKNSNI